MEWEVTRFQGNLQQPGGAQLQSSNKPEGQRDVHMKGGGGGNASRPE